MNRADAGCARSSWGINESGRSAPDRGRAVNRCRRRTMPQVGFGPSSRGLAGLAGNAGPLPFNLRLQCRETLEKARVQSAIEYLSGATLFACLTPPP